MSGKSSPPSTKSINPDCPNPDIVANTKLHFGQQAWEWQCPHAEEVIVAGKGIKIKCSLLNQRCCVDDNQKYFVNSPKTEPLRSFFETTLKYFGVKTDGKTEKCFTYIIPKQKKLQQMLKLFFCAGGETRTLTPRGTRS